MAAPTLPTTMRAVVLDAPGHPTPFGCERSRPPRPRRAGVLLKMQAFGLNRSEFHTRLGLAHGVTFPRVPGIEATGTFTACPGGESEVGAQVMAMMGGMGRTFNGGYAEYTCVPAKQVLAFEWPKHQRRGEGLFLEFQPGGSDTCEVGGRRPSRA
jgi:NADPH:quinone reductase-like Zn-dependent oxidoreductase